MKKVIIMGIVLSVLLFSLFVVPDIHAQSDYPLLLGAHRGSSVEHVENTLDAIEAAVKDERFNFIEIDLQYTKDKKVVVFHDSSLWRLQKKPIRIDSLTYEELLELSDYYIPLYDEVMDLIGEGKKVNIEIKARGDFSESQYLVDFLIIDCQERGLDIMLSSLDENLVRYISESYPDTKNGIIYLFHNVTYIPSAKVVNEFYQDMSEMGADYVILHGLNMKNYSRLIKQKPEEITLMFWYFNDQMLLMQKDAGDKLW